jgi:hypothetical protein
MKLPKVNVENGLKTPQCHSEMLALICLGIEKLVHDKEVPDAVAADDVRRIKQHCTDILEARLAAAVTGHAVPRRRRDKLRITPPRGL